MSDHTGSAADSAGDTGDSPADRSPPEDRSSSEGGDEDSDSRAGDGTDEETPAAGADATDDEQETTATGDETADETDEDVPRDVQKYERFKKMDGARYERVNEFLRDRTYITAREWAIARLCADFRTETGVEMTKIGENLPELVPFMTDTYTPQAVNQARYSFEEKVTKAGATFLYGAMSGFFTAEDLDEMMYEVTEVAKFLLEVEGVDLAVADELEAEDKISEVMRDVRASSADLRGEEVRCPECGHVHKPTEE
ncbi:DUF5806 family protein [Halorubrum distributum]|uniref:Uncharacterized protein n=1 Tax=Halorubrum distributum JCM 13916 TaxID=1230455 RepID=M0PH86_9EURY|nr:MULTISPECIES: DUF5806 family protein [Halorubrum distributum group]EMA69427.1 hypothetical protein C462_12752 [Halorubrum arcis JCM 13916]MDV7350775.1 DUF5806 family protein [Halorubrum distributum]